MGFEAEAACTIPSLGFELQGLSWRCGGHGCWGGCCVHKSSPHSAVDMLTALLREPAHTLLSGRSSEAEGLRVWDG